MCHRGQSRMPGDAGYQAHREQEDRKGIQYKDNASQEPALAVMYAFMYCLGSFKKTAFTQFLAKSFQLFFVLCHKDHSYPEHICPRNVYKAAIRPTTKNLPHEGFITLMEVLHDFKNRIFEINAERGR